MSARVWLGVMVAGTTLVVLAGSRPASEPRAPVTRRPSEAPWLSREAASQIIGSRGGLGPLFEGIELGGPAPSAGVRARIAQFARANNVKIELEIAEDEVAAVRFEVMFGGCCGYEGADVLALRLDRPTAQDCCGCEKSWLDDWAITTDDGAVLRARVRVNRVSVRWERPLTVDDLVERRTRIVDSRSR